jgi:hypothetical protein
MQAARAYDGEMTGDYNACASSVRRDLCWVICRDPFSGAVPLPTRCVTSAGFQRAGLSRRAGSGPRYSLPPPISLNAFSAARTGLLPLPKDSNEACSEAAGDQQKEEISGRVAHEIYEATRMPLS